MSKSIEPFYIKKSSDTPEVLMDKVKGIIKFSGRSLPENCEDFYNPILKWIENYAKSGLVKTEVILQFDYLNSASTQRILQILELLKTVFGKDQNKLLSIEWQYNHHDHDIFEAGKDFENWTKMKFKFTKNS